MTAKLTAKQRRRIAKVYGRGDGRLVKDFVPRGRSSFTIYAVALREHPGIVKVGQTGNWTNRRQTYQNWNLSKGDALSEATRFILTEEFVDLRKLESHVLAAVGRAFSLHYGSEWFAGDYDEIVRLIDQVIAETGLTYEIEQHQ